MTVNDRIFTDWSARTDWLAARFEKPSPNLVAILTYLRGRWGGVSMGIHGNRPVRGGESPSDHAFGAALDWRWEAHPQYASARFITRDVLDSEVLPFLVANSLELGIQAIHDEGRIWRSNRPGTAFDAVWKDYKTGYDGWLHITTTLDHFDVSTPVERRVPGNVIVTPVNPPAPVHNFGLYPVNPNKPTLRVFGPTNDPGTVQYLQKVLLALGYSQIGNANGTYNAVTDASVRLFQAARKLVSDGIVGPKTWAAIDAEAKRLIGA